MSEKLLKGGEYLIKNTNAEDVFTPEDFTDEQKQIAETTEQFVVNEIVPQMDEIESQNFDIIIEGMKKCGELGLLMIDAPEEYGGLELDKATSMLVAEKLAPGGSFLVAYAAHTGIGLLPLIYYGTKEQKDKYLEKLMTGEMLAAYCLTEPGSGSDALGAKTSAVLSDDGKYYLLNGTKQWITNAGFADLFTVFAKVDKEHFTAFLVERDFEGISFGAEEKKMGIKGSSTRQVNFDNAKVPVENVLGEVGRGHKVAFNVLNVGRFKLAAATTGACKDALGEAVRYANERKQFGTEISNFGAIKEKIARMTAETFASESFVYRLSGLLDDKIARIDKGVENYYEEYQKAIEDYAIECGMSKVFCSEVLAYVVDETVQIFGGYGYSQEYPAERFYRDERINRIFEGTNEINRLLTPGILLKKTMKGELPLQKEAMRAMESLMTPSFDEPEDGLFSSELKLIDDLKTVFLVTAGAAVQKHMEKMKNEQEILMALADVAIGIFAIESTVLRALKIYEKSNDNKKKLLEAAVNLFVFHEVEDITRAAKKAAYFVEDGDNLAMLLSGIRRFTKYDATGLLENQRLLANAVIDAEKYVF